MEIEATMQEHKESKFKKSPQKRSAGGAELRASLIYCGAAGAKGPREPAPRWMVARCDICLNSFQYLHLTR